MWERRTDISSTKSAWGVSWCIGGKEMRRTSKIVLETLNLLLELSLVDKLLLE